jgi:hypothetical protein
MNLFKTLAVLGLVGVGMIDGGVCKETKDSDSATNPVVSSRWEVDGWTSTQKPEEADFAVTVSYTVPGVVKDSDTHYFKKFYSEVKEYADGTTLQSACGSGSGLGKSRCGGGSGCIGAANVDPTNDGLKVFLDLRWSGKKSGKLKREFLVPWSELEKSVKDDDCEIHVTVNYSKPSKPTPQ